LILFFSLVSFGIQSTTERTFPTMTDVNLTTSTRVFNHIVEHDYNNSVLQLLYANYDNVKDLMKEKYEISNAMIRCVLLLIQDRLDDCVIYGYVINNNNDMFEFVDDMDEAREIYLHYRDTNSAEYSLLSEEERNDVMRHIHEEITIVFGEEDALNRSNAYQNADENENVEESSILSDTSILPGIPLEMQEYIDTLLSTHNSEDSDSTLSLEDTTPALSLEELVESSNIFEESRNQ